ncbi:Neural proliferation differentiation and control protein 1 [Nymphon striatum]|nr:Neural proliferation differentiation and control protein 1 [Nymphon striatum]
MELVKRTLRYFLKLFFPTENAIFISIITFVTWSGDVTKSVSSNQIASYYHIARREVWSLQGWLGFRKESVIKIWYDLNFVYIFHVKREREERLEKGVRQGDSTSPKIFTACLENVFRCLNWTSKGIPINGDRLTNLRFADDVVLFSELQKNTKAAADTEYPAYGVTGPNKGDNTSPSGDRKLAQSAQMYHYQHQKQQMIALEKAGTDRNQSASDVDSEEENEEGDYTVYECPGLAPTGEMEVKNPLFNEQPTPTSPSLKKSNYNENETLPEKESTKM